MIRAVAVLACGLLVGGAAPTLPLPPMPPANPPMDEPAPVPDPDLSYGSSAVPSVQFSLRMFSMHEYGTGLAYIPGSEYQSPEERKAMQTPGLTVSVPMR